MHTWPFHAHADALISPPYRKAPKPHVNTQPLAAQTRRAHHHRLGGNGGGEGHVAAANLDDLRGGWEEGKADAEQLGWGKGRRKAVRRASCLVSRCR